MLIHQRRILFIFLTAGMHHWMSLLCLPNSLKSLIWKIQSTHFLNSFHCYKKANCSCSNTAQQERDMPQPNANRAQLSVWQLRKLGLCCTGGQGRSLIPSPFDMLLSLFPFPSLRASPNHCCFASVFCWSFYMVSGKEQEWSLNSEFLLQV